MHDHRHDYDDPIRDQTRAKAWSGAGDEPFAVRSGEVYLAKPDVLLRAGDELTRRDGAVVTFVEAVRDIDGYWSCVFDAETSTFSMGMQMLRMKLSDGRWRPRE